MPCDERAQRGVVHVVERVPGRETSSAACCAASTTS